MATAVVLITAGIDHANTDSKVPPVPDQCGTSSRPVGCPPGDNPFLERLDEARDLSAGFGDRAWAYSIAVILIAGFYLAVRLRRADDETGSREAYTDVGIAGVAWLVAMGLFMFFGEMGRPRLIEIPGWPAFAPGIAMVVAAVFGTVTSSGPATAPSEPSPRTADPDEREMGAFAAWPWYIKAGAVLAAGAIVVGLISGAGRPECGERPPDWTDTGFEISFILAVGALACGIAALVARRWMLALLLVTIAPVGSLFIALANACLS